MALLEAGLMIALLTILVFIISGLPLHWAVKLMHGNTTLLKTAFVSLVLGILASFIQRLFSLWGGVIAFIVVIWAYHALFDLSYPKAFFAWILQLVFVVLMVMGLGLIGITLITSAVFF